MTYEEAVLTLRADPALEQTLRSCYLDEDVCGAAERFRASEEFDDIKRLLGKRAVGRLKVLDLGCGNGISCYAFACAGHVVYGLDPDMSKHVGLGAARSLLQACRGHIRLIRGTAESIPFGAGTFDVVYMRQAAHHFRDLEQGASECARVLKPGGMLLATREHVVSDEAERAVFLEEHILHRLHSGENAYPAERYASAFQNSGLSLARVLGPFDSPITHYPISRASLKQMVLDGLAHRLGWIPARLLSSFSPVQRICQRRKSRRDRTPGRLYAFVFVKPARSRARTGRRPADAF